MSAMSHYLESGLIGHLFKEYYLSPLPTDSLYRLGWKL